jgi:hypothetical protein
MRLEDGVQFKTMHRTCSTRQAELAVHEKNATTCICMYARRNATSSTQSSQIV